MVEAFILVQTGIIEGLTENLPTFIEKVIIYLITMMDTISDQIYKKW